MASWGVATKCLSSTSADGTIPILCGRPMLKALGRSPRVAPRCEACVLVDRLCSANVPLRIDMVRVQVEDLPVVSQSNPF